MAAMHAALAVLVAATHAALAAAAPAVRAAFPMIGVATPTPLPIAAPATHAALAVAVAATHAALAVVVTATHAASAVPLAAVAMSGMSAPPALQIARRAPAAPSLTTGITFATAEKIPAKRRASHAEMRRKRLLVGGREDQRRFQ